MRQARQSWCRREAVLHRHALVEDEAFALPAALLGHLLQIGEDAALQVIDILEPLGLEERRSTSRSESRRCRTSRFLAAPPSQLAAMRAEPGGKVAEAPRARIDRAGEVPIATS
jgi:hypothetical protein